MAKKKDENQLAYLQMPLPSGRKYAKMTKRSWSGLNYRQKIDTGALSMEKNISTAEAPYLVPAPKKIDFSTSVAGLYRMDYDISEQNDTRKEFRRPLDVFGFGDLVVVVYKERQVAWTTGSKTELKDLIKVDYLIPNASGTKVDETVFTGVIGFDDETSGMTGYQYSEYIETKRRSIVQFNHYDTPTDPLTGEYVKKLVVFPDKVAMPMNIELLASDSKEPYRNPALWNSDTPEAREALATADPKAMYCYVDNDNKGICKYYVIDKVKQIEADADGIEKVTYVRKCRQSGGDNYFMCDSLEVTVKAYTNTVAETDQSGATVYPPPETADKNCYYKNTYNDDVYRYCTYDTATEDEDGNWIPDGGTTEGWKVCLPPAMPNIKHATVHLSRVFGVDDERVYASGFNDYTNWNFDTSAEYSESNAWCSPAQSNTRAGGGFTGVTNFQGHVVCFKRDFMHEIYNNQNPFRIVDVYAEGTIDHRTVQDVDGKLIFVSDDDVKIYTGSNPRIIGYNLGINKYEKAVSGTDGRCYYLYCEFKQSQDADEPLRRLFVYDTYVEQWSEREIEQEIIGFATTNKGIYAFCDDGIVYKLDTDKYAHNWSFETDLITNTTVDIKHIKKMQMFAHIGENAWIKVYMLYDDEVFDENKSHLVYDSNGRTGQSAIRVKPRQTASYGIKLHVEGCGYVRLYEMELLIEGGGNLYV